MDFDIVAADQSPSELRERYFRSLPEPQVHYLEQRVALARTFVARLDSFEVAYAAVHDAAIVEFFALDNVLPDLSAVFFAAATCGDAASAVIKSYDALALAAAGGRPARIATIGVNCTTWSEDRFDPPRGFAARRGGFEDDLAIMQAIGPGLFERPEEAGNALAAGQVTIYELSGEPIGCGLLTPVRQGAPELDLGVGVLPAWRGQGLGEQIVRHLKRVCLHELGVRPVCGCAVENVASRRTLENAGFLTRHRLLRFDWSP